MKQEQYNKFSLQKKPTSFIKSNKKLFHLDVKNDRNKKYI